jgi:hypothetical protein
MEMKESRDTRPTVVFSDLEHETSERTGSSSQAVGIFKSKSTPQVVSHPG